MQHEIQRKSIDRWNIYDEIFQLSGSLWGERDIQTDGEANAKAEVWMNMTFGRNSVTWWWLKEGGVGKE